MQSTSRAPGGHAGVDHRDPRQPARRPPIRTAAWATPRTLRTKTHGETPSARAVSTVRIGSTSVLEIA